MEEPKDLLGDKLSRELQAYARSVRTKFVDVTRPVKEQEREVEAFVQELVKRGGREVAVRRYVKESLSRERYKFAKKQTRGNVESGRE